MSKRLLALVSGLIAAVLVAASTAAADDSNVGVQTADQSAASGQQATAVSGATQVQPSNTNISVRVLSPGNDGSVTQANTVGSSATAANLNGTSQDADQTQAGSGTGIQTAEQSASNAQLAGAFSLATQYGASNTNVPVRVGSYGSSGDVTQINAADSEATAANVNGTKQDADQTQAGGHNPCHPCSDGSTGIQTVDQDADSKQVAAAKSATFQLKPTNVNTAVRVGSPGDGGDVYQANVASSEAKAANANATSSRRRL